MFGPMEFPIKQPLYNKLRYSTIFLDASMVIEKMYLHCVIIIKVLINTHYANYETSSVRTFNNRLQPHFSLGFFQPVKSTWPFIFFYI